MAYPTNVTNTAAVSTAVVITLTAGNSMQRAIRHLSWSYNIDLIAAAVVGGITIKSPTATTMHQFDIIQGGPGFMNFDGDGFAGASGEALIVTLSAVTGAIGKLNVTQVG